MRKEYLAHYSLLYSCKAAIYFLNVDRTTHSKDIFIRNFWRWRAAASSIIDLIQSEVDPHDPPTPKIPP